MMVTTSATALSALSASTTVARVRSSPAWRARHPTTAAAAASGRVTPAQKTSTLTKARTPRTRPATVLPRGTTKAKTRRPTASETASMMNHSAVWNDPSSL